MVSLRCGQSQAFCGVKRTDLEIRNDIPQLCGYGTLARCQVSCGWHEFPYVTLALLSYHQKLFFLGHGKNSFGSHLPLMKRCYNYANCTSKGGWGARISIFGLYKNILHLSQPGIGSVLQILEQSFCKSEWPEGAGGTLCIFIHLGFYQNSYLRTLITIYKGPIYPHDLITSQRPRLPIITILGVEIAIYGSVTCRHSVQSTVRIFLGRKTHKFLGFTAIF